MSEARFYHIPKIGKLNRCERVQDAMELVDKEGGFFWLHYLEPVHLGMVVILVGVYIINKK